MAAQDGAYHQLDNAGIDGDDSMQQSVFMSDSLDIPITDPPLYRCPEQTEPTGNSIQIETQLRNNTVTWEDVNSQIQSENDLHLDIFLDTLASIALFRLHGDIQLTHRNASSSKQPVYLFIYPEDIECIDFDAAETLPFDTLRFKLRRNPYLVAPRDSVLEPNSSDIPLHRSIQALATATEIIVQISNSETNSLSHTDLGKIASAFSPNHKILIDARRANLDALYAHESGEVLNLGKPAKSLEVDYSSADDAALAEDATTHVRIPSLPEDIMTRFGTINNGLNSLCKLLDDMNTRLERLEKMTAAALDADYNPLVHGPEETAQMLAEVSKLVDQGIVEFKTECEEVAKETLSELRNEFNQVAEQIRGETTKNGEPSWQ
ncbi:hypothetical protein GGI43DRAFT_413292 [Trichoderma evansii]